MSRRTNPVFRSLNRPLTLIGAERKLFFLALLMGASVFTRQSKHRRIKGLPRSQICF